MATPDYWREAQEREEMIKELYQKSLLRRDERNHVLGVPLRQQLTNSWCGPASVQMTLLYLNPSFNQP